jgi:hypothetical protein
VVVVLMVLATLTAAVRSARRPLVDDLRNASVNGTPRARWTFRLPGTVVPLGIQDPLTRPVRSFFSFLAVTVAISGCLASFGLRSTIGSMGSEGLRAGEKWDVMLWSMDSRPNEQLIPIVARLPGVRSVFTSRSDPATLENGSGASKNRFLAVAQGGDFSAKAVNLVQGRAVNAAGEATAGEGFLKSFHHRIGDSVKFKVRGTVLRVHIVGSFRDTTNGGNVLRYRWEQIRAVEPGVTVGRVLVLADSRQQRRSVLRAVQQATGTRAQSFGPRGIDSEIGTVRWILLLVGAFIVVVSLAQLGGAWFVGAREQEKDLALMTAIGLTRSQLRWRSGIGAGVVAGAAWLAAIPLGFVALQIIGRVAVARAGLGSDILRYADGP